MELKADVGAPMCSQPMSSLKSRYREASEVVIVGAHLDSWHGGTGATDNASGSAVAMEAMRILKDLEPEA